MLDSMIHHIGLQMTTGSGIDLENGYIKGGNTVGIVRGLLVSFNDTDLRGNLRTTPELNRRIVSSNSVVLPEPGELIRFRQKICFASK